MKLLTMLFVQALLGDEQILLQVSFWVDGQEQEYSVPATFPPVISYSSVSRESVFKDKALTEMVLVLGLTQNCSRAR